MRVSNLHIRWLLGLAAWLLHWTYEPSTYVHTWLSVFAILMWMSVFAPMFGERVITLTFRRREGPPDDD